MKKQRRKISCIGIIPARFDSQRLPGKPLVSIAGKPMIEQVYRRVKKAKSLDDVIVATDDKRIYQAVKKFGGEVFLTPKNIKSGSDRVAFVAKKINCDIVVNIQGDEPTIKPQMIDQLVESLKKEPQIPVATLVRKIENKENLGNPNVVKVVKTKENMALYFSRYCIPYVSSENGSGKYDKSKLKNYFEHIGIYAYRKNFLLKFTRMPPSPLERAEKLEQLRVLENGYKIKLVETKFKTHPVDNKSDIKIVEKILRNE